MNRIFDDQSRPRIYLESSAMITILAMVENNSFSLVSSEVLRYEIPATLSRKGDQSDTVHHRSDEGVRECVKPPKIL